MIDILRNLLPETAGKLQVEHRGIGTIQSVGQRSRLPAQILHVTCHVTDDDGVDNSLDGDVSDVDMASEKRNTSER